MQNFEPAQIITPDALKRKMAEESNLIVIDTVIRDRYDAVHIEGAKHACVFEVNFLEQVAAIVPEHDSQIVVYGSSGKTMDAITAADKLVRAGYVHVAILEGGLRAWRTAGLPLSGEKAGRADEPAPGIVLPEGTHPVDTENSIIEWAGRNPNSKHHGTVGLSTGEIVVKDGRITGSFEIDMNTIENINLRGDELLPVLIDHLKSDDFFFVKRYPTARFTIDSATESEEPQGSSAQFRCEGQLGAYGG
jgi:rhodanese-related sulfurtransferase